MEAELVSELPQQGGWRYEPKWDGFRGVLENDGGALALWSRNGRPLLRYFPELRAVGERLPPHSALDGEIVIERDGALDFDAMQMRLHPAESRIRKLSAETPATFIAFDILLWDGQAIHGRPLAERRLELEKRAAAFTLSPPRTDRQTRLPAMVDAGRRGEGRMPGGQSRWSQGKDLEWVEVRPEIVCEVRYDKMEAERFRHGTRFLRFRPDKDPRECTWDQVRPRPKSGDPVLAELLRS